MSALRRHSYRERCNLGNTEMTLPLWEVQHGQHRDVAPAVIGATWATPRQHSLCRRCNMSNAEMSLPLWEV